MARQTRPLIHVQQRIGGCMRMLIRAVMIYTVAAAHARFFEQRNEVSFRRGKSNSEFFRRHSETFRNGAAIHYAHAKEHDVLQLTPLSDTPRIDAKTDEDFTSYLLQHRAFARADDGILRTLHGAVRVGGLSRD
jgi:hypothetical protein